MVTKAGEQFTSFWPLLWALGGLCGIWFSGTTVMRVIRANRFPGAPMISAKEAIGLMISAALMANLSVFINNFWNSYGSGQTVYGALSYSGAAGLGQLSAALGAVLTIASVFGGFYFFKGLLMFKNAQVGDSSQSGDQAWRGLGVMLFSSALINIVPMIESFRQTFGLVW
ncbi:conjugal transfer protein TraQ [Zooshikella ganghwensis]|nr:conjugal transfer protein TraQ [Zooshikella ganghwensis]